MVGQPTILTPKHKYFFLFAGFVYFLLAIAAVGFDITLIFYSYWTWYLGFSGSGLLISGGITAIIVTFYSTYTMIYLLYAYIPVIFVNFIVWILLIINLALTKRCHSHTPSLLCDDTLALSLKIGLIVIYSFAGILTTIIVIIITKSNKNSMHRSPRISSCY